MSPVDYTVELDYCEDLTPLKVGDLVEMPPNYVEFPRPHVCRIVDRERSSKQDSWILDPDLSRDPDPEVVDESYVVWPTDADDDLTRVLEEPALPAASDLERWITEGMSRDGLSPAAYVRVERQ